AVDLHMLIIVGQNVAVGIGVGVDEQSLTGGVGVVGSTVGQNNLGARSAVISSQGQGSGSGQVVVGIILGVLHVGHNSQEGVDHDDAVGIDLSQTALGTNGVVGSSLADVL